MGVGIQNRTEIKPGSQSWSRTEKMAEIQSRNDFTSTLQPWVKPMICDQDRREIDAFTLSAMLRLVLAKRCKVLLLYLLNRRCTVVLLTVSICTVQFYIRIIYGQWLYSHYQAFFV